MESRRTYKKVKFEERILNEVNLILKTKFSDARLKFISVTRVELSSDFSVADIYWDSFDSSKRGDAKKAVENIKGKVRTLLSGTLNVRHVPIVNFLYDSQFDSERNIENILSSEAKLGREY